MPAPLVVISNTSGTGPLAIELAQALASRGIRTWAGPRDLEVGRQWQLELHRAMDKADSFIFLVDPRSSVSPWQETEWRAILAKVWTDANTRVIPVLIGSAVPPPFLRNWVSITVDPVKEPHRWTERVVDAVESIRSSNTRPLPAKSKREREKRLAEIGKAAKALSVTPEKRLTTAVGR